MDRLRHSIVWLRKIAPERYVLLALFALAVLCWWLALAALPRPLEVTIYAVGKGDALLLRSPTGRTVLIDGGSSSIPDVGARRLVPNLLLRGVRRLDAILITHHDSDHLNGLAAVLDALPVGMLLDPEVAENEGILYQQLLHAAEQHRVPRYRVRAGTRFNLGGGAMLRVLSPGVELLDGTAADSNNNSVVCRLDYRRSSMLFTGDLEADGERRLLETGLPMRADILKVAHHGSRNSTGVELLAAVQPSLAVISCSGTGDHPHPETLARLNEQRVLVRRTDVCGQIILRTAGAGWRCETFRSPGQSSE